MLRQLIRAVRNRLRKRRRLKANWCAICKVVLTPQNAGPGALAGRYRVCRSCQAARQRKRYAESAKHREYCAEYVRKQVASGYKREYYRARRALRGDELRAKARARYHANPERYREYARRAYYKRKERNAAAAQDVQSVGS